MKNLGIIILLIGLALTIFSGHTFFTRKKVIDIGKVEVTKDEPHTFEWPTWLGIVVMGAGVIILYRETKRNK